MQHIFIINPASGKKKGKISIVSKIQQALINLSIKDYKIIYTKAPKHAIEIATHYAKTGEEVRLYAVGGDGTLNEVMRGAYPYKNAQVASVPVGSGNDFIRNFGTAEDFLDIESQIQGTGISIDLMRVNEEIALAIACTGLDADVAYNLPKYRKFGGMAYQISIIDRVLHKMGRNLRVTVDGQVIEKEYLIATVCNGGYYGGGYWAAPMSSLTDGKLDVVLVNKIGRARIVKIIGKYKKGAHYQNGEIIPQLHDVIDYRSGKHIIIEPVDDKEIITIMDGESDAVKKMEIEVMPLAGIFSLPEKIAEKYIQENVVE